MTIGEKLQKASFALHPWLDSEIAVTSVGFCPYSITGTGTESLGHHSGLAFKGEGGMIYVQSVRLKFLSYSIKMY